MTHAPQIKIPAVYMRGGTSKGVFFRLQDLPEAARVPGEARDKFLLRVIGSPDPYAKHIDGMGGATPGTSKTVIVSRSARPCHDVDCLFGEVDVGNSFVDWNGECGSLSAAVGAFAIGSGIIHRERLRRGGIVDVRIWQANIGKTIIVRVPVVHGQAQETDDFQLEFIDPVVDVKGTGSAMFPTGKLWDELDVPGIGTLPATLVNAGVPTIFVNATDIGYTGTALQETINGDPKALAMFETIRAHGAVRMGLIGQVEEAARSRHVPKLAFVAPPADYVSTSGRQIAAGDIDLVVRVLSMGKLHDAMMDTVAVAIGSAAAIHGTVVGQAAAGDDREVRIGHPSGTLRVGGDVLQIGGEWIVIKTMMRQSARVLMEGHVGVPDETV
ncbi:2-methylaconitate cis-trans isomerase PrpF [Massilia putida]|uniref:2-methylaconitate cis-trans isomerase PrpF n=1 Tax=Massilia putida TaxID=1141883 RepID=UPI0009522623|nr:2-methylaconitate cis-trans isomerase PrpF [Massilia putida]